MISTIPGARTRNHVAARYERDPVDLRSVNSLAILRPRFPLTPTKFMRPPLPSILIYSYRRTDRHSEATSISVPSIPRGSIPRQNVWHDCLQRIYTEKCIQSTVFRTNIWMTPTLRVNLHREVSLPTMMRSPIAVLLPRPSPMPKYKRKYLRRAIESGSLKCPAAASASIFIEHCKVSG